MTEQEWLSFTDPRPVLRAATLSDQRKLRLLCVACCNRIMQYYFDERSRESVRVAEQFADGLATEDELEAANNAAYLARSIQTGNGCAPDAAFGCSENRLDAHWCLDACTGAADWGFPAGYVSTAEGREREQLELGYQAALLRDIFGNPFRPVGFDPAWRTDTTVAIARGMYESRDFSAMPILADALQDAGCDNDDVLNHCRDAGGVHVRGCWVVDLVLGKA